MTVTVQEIANVYAQRRIARGPELARMAEVQSLYDGDITVPLPELNRNERNSLPNRVREGMKQFSQRIASALPSIKCFPVRYGIEKSEKQAEDRRRALYGWWEFNRMDLILRQRARYFQGYGSSPVQIRWDNTRGIPKWETRNPLSTYPSMLRGPEEMCPSDCVFDTTQTLAWLMARYPAQTNILYKGSKDRPAMDGRYTVLEYVDADECVLVALGAPPDSGYTPPPGSMTVELDRYPNRAQQCPVVIPRQISLSAPHGQFDGMAGMYQTEALLTAMAIIATRKGVFADEWLVAHPNEEPVIVQVPDATEGIPGVVKGGQLVPRGVDPQFQTNIMIDRLADAQMRTSGLSSELQGIAPTNVRTGARASLLLSNVIDFPIQEAQEIFQESLQEEDKKAIAFAKAYGERKSFYVSWRGATGPVTYDPATTFETDQNQVRYPMAGVDQAGLVISAGQRIGMGTMSKESFMELDPLVRDPEHEHDRIVSEKLEDAVVNSISQQAAAGTLDPVLVARIHELVEQGAEIFEAVQQSHREAQQLQAAQAPAGSPGTMPGLTGPAQQPSIGPTPNSTGLAQLLSTLRSPQKALPQELTQTAGPPVVAGSPTG